MSSDPAASAPSVDPARAVRSGDYPRRLAFAANLGVPVAVFAYGFLEATSKLRDWVFTDLPPSLGFTAEPAWWPLPVLTVAGLLVGSADSA